MTLTVIWVRTSFSKPCISADTEYVPGGIEANKYRPLLSDVVLKGETFGLVDQNDRGSLHDGPARIRHLSADGSEVGLPEQRHR